MTRISSCFKRMGQKKTPLAEVRQAKFLTMDLVQFQSSAITICGVRTVSYFHLWCQDCELLSPVVSGLSYFHLWCQDCELLSSVVLGL